MDNTSHKINTEKLTILYNACLGRWQPGHKAVQIFNAIMCEKYISFAPYISACEFYSIERHNPILVKIYEILGKEFDDVNSETRVKVIDKKYEKYYHIEDYDDGVERVVINYAKYELDVLQQSVNNALVSN